MSRRHFSIVMFSLIVIAGYLPVMYPYASYAMKFLFSSILLAASRFLWLIVTPPGFKMSAVAVNFLKPFGVRVALKMLSAPALLGVSLT